MDNKLEKIRVGVIGSGSFAKKHISFWERSEKTELIGVYSENISKDLYSKKLEYKDLIERSDIIDIVTLNYKNFIYLKEILKKKKVVIVEKPYCINLKQLKEIESIIKILKIKNYSIFQYKFNENYKEFLKLDLEHINLINVYGYYKRDVNFYKKNNAWRLDYNKSGGGVLINQGIHIIDLLRIISNEKLELHKSNSKKYLSENIESDVTINGKIDDVIINLSFNITKIFNFETIIVNTKNEIVQFCSFGVFKSKYKLINYGKIIIFKIKNFFYKKSTSNEFEQQLNYIVDNYRSSNNSKNMSGILDAVKTHEYIFKCYEI